MAILVSRRRGYAPRIIDWSKQYLTFEALEAGEFSFTNNLEYSLNKGAWTSLTGGTALSVSQGDKVRWRATITPTSSEGIGTFSATCEFNATGNPLSVRIGDSFVNSTEMPNVYYNFVKLFYQNTKLVNAKNLILTSKTLRYYCYQNMFNGCTALVTPPVILATTGSQYSCRNMFSGCSSMTAVPSFTMSCSDSTFIGMFKNCTSIVTANNITLQGSGGYASCKEMFMNCNHLTTPPTINITSFSSSQSFSSMFEGCSALTTAPNLPATTIRESCYNSMFKNCTSLVTAPQMAVTTFSGVTAMQNMFNGCTSLVNAPSLPATTLANNCYNGMFNGCKALETAPDLPAPTLAAGCYSSMFSGCSKLKYIKCLATNISASSSRYNWVNGVASSGTFVKDANMSDWPSGAAGIPSGWTVQDYVES